ncbi:MAG TPA: hypothetical protein V6D37_01340 [Candidatus Sericytochromatia bacterium]
MGNAIRVTTKNPQLLAEGGHQGASTFIYSRSRLWHPEKFQTAIAL